MAEHLIKAGHSLLVYNRTASKSDSLLAIGARFAPVSEIAASCSVVFTMLGYPNDVAEVVLGADGIVAAMRPGSLLIDHTSSSPSLAQQIAEAASLKGIESLDAPVTGGDVGARNGTLAIMVGGSADAFERGKELMGAYAQNIRHMGTAGLGQHAKLTNQIILSGNMIGMVEGLLYSYKAGLDCNTIIELLSTGAAGSFALKNLGPRILRRDFEPGFYVEHYIKDMGLALEEARRLNLSLPGLALVNQFYLSLQANGEGRKGTQALIKALERLNGLELLISPS
jgi:3-hydroxyisobutyrate dehydrogenase